MHESLTPPSYLDEIMQQPERPEEDGYAMETGDLFEWTFETSKGPVDMLAEVVVEGVTIHLKDVTIFPRTAKPLTGLLREVLGARSQLAGEMRELGFERLRITGKRVATSSSANPGKEIDITIDLIEE
jgi:hypothetical protein